jgi:hypothetical protein
MHLSSAYTPKNTEYRPGVEMQLPSRDLLLAEVQSLQQHVFNHVTEF